jgi:hypothetical protein
MASGASEYVAMARTTPDWEPESEEDYEVARSELKKRFDQWLEVVGIESRGDDGEAPFHYKWAYVDGHLTRWRRRDLDEVYLELHPAKVMVEDDDLDRVLEEAKAFISFLDETGLLDPTANRPTCWSTISTQLRSSSATAWPTPRVIASASACGRRRWPRASAWTIELRSRLSWLTSTPGRLPNAMPSWVRDFPRGRRPPSGSPAGHQAQEPLSQAPQAPALRNGLAQGRAFSSRNWLTVSRPVGGILFSPCGPW